MRIITTEEHWVSPGIAAAGAAANAALSPHFNEAFDPTNGYPLSPAPGALIDLDHARIVNMDRNGIDTQVLSVLGPQLLPSAVAVDLTRAANDHIASVIEGNPDRFAAFAAIPTTAGGDASANELERCMARPGFTGSLIFGRSEERFLDQAEYEPFLAASARLHAPIYLHPTPPPRGISDLISDGLAPDVSARFETAAWGWHIETGTHFLHMALSGVFDRHPELHVILGHWGEMVPFWMDRLDQALPPAMTGCAQPISGYLRNNVFVTPSGMWQQSHLRYCLDVLGADRIIFSVDYPFIDNQGAREFLEQADLTASDRDKIAHGNAERLLGL